MSLLSVLTAALVAVPAVAPPAAPPLALPQRQGVDTVAEWYDTTVATIAAAPAATQVTNSRTWAISWLAAARALRRRPAPPAFRDAALASAVHRSLVALVPARKTELDAALATALARIPEGASKRRGIAAGVREADALLREREGDGLDPASVNRAYTPQPAAPGVWQPTPPTFSPGAQAGTRLARPFLLSRADQYRPAPPPALDSERYRKDLEEVRVYGALNSTARTQAQTDTAQFWYGSSLTLYDGVLGAAVRQSADKPQAWRAGLVAIFHVALVDTQIATSDAKYAYVLWRPVTALRVTDPEWTPLHNTPAHPDYPSGHNTYSGAAEKVLTALVGYRAKRPYTITSPTQPGATRTYTDWKKPTEENVNARVWSGIHTRSADETGVRLGGDVAAHALRDAVRLFR
ncbi:vanadium-dependent haloperoxidase [Spongiactinospora sp. TRM90649]|uniref:vanadium-dependent haloperoxidase n=1 Tax=Spongiactinospora sp. TRM90649 TaxID=3031114 RepID=UPI0023F9CD06|nr:vanadium-dependent haloperoxidase [Spongiactinospora sp. TRM90649]MDF5755505.1 vanadium-dependent haloperoxidase [Spongiactinospora sp. TRM90649]